MPRAVLSAAIDVSTGSIVRVYTSDTPSAVSGVARFERRAGELLVDLANVCAASETDAWEALQARIADPASGLAALADRLPGEQRSEVDRKKVSLRPLHDAQEAARAAEQELLRARKDGEAREAELSAMVRDAEQRAKEQAARAAKAEAKVAAQESGARAS